MLLDDMGELPQTSDRLFGHIIVDEVLVVSAGGRKEGGVRMRARHLMLGDLHQNHPRHYSWCLRGRAGVQKVTK